MPKITYLTGDATYPIGPEIKIIPHICNNLGGWGAGFVVAISKKWKQPEQQYRSLNERPLGLVQLIKVEEDIFVANMIAQEGVYLDEKGNPPIRYAAVKECLKKVNKFAEDNGATLHMPKIGCGLAGGSWKEIEKILNKTVSVDVFVYDLK